MPSRRAILLGGAASLVPLPAWAQCIRDGGDPNIPTCRGMIGVPGIPNPSLDLSLLAGPLDGRITFTRASNASYFDAAGVLQNSAYNLIRNNTMAGAIVGTPGTLPTNWTVPTADGLTTNVIGVGTDGNGTTYIDLQVTGSPTGTSYVLQLDSVTSTSGLPYTYSAWTAVVGGSTANITSLRAVLGNSGGLNIAWNTTAALVRGSVTQASSAGTGYQPQIAFTTVISQAVNVTLRIGLPQVEQSAAASVVATPTSGAANGAPRFDYDPVTHAARGLLIEEARTNLLLNSAALGTQSVTTTAVATTLSFYGTGTVTLTGTFSGSLVGAGAFPARNTLTFTPTAGTLTATVTGSVLNAQIEAGAFATSYIPTTGATATRAADVATVAQAPAASATLAVDALTPFAVSKAVTLAAFTGASGKTGLTGNASNQVAMFDTTGAVNASLGSEPVGVPFKSAMAFAAGAQAGCLNGGSVVTTSAATLTASETSLGIGYDGTSQQPNSAIRRIRYWPSVLTSAQLQAVTQ